MDHVFPNISQSNYVIDGELGRGQAGAVYSATDKSGLNRFAIKVFHDADAHNRSLIESEYSLLCQLRHPHILPIIDFGQTSSGQYFWVLPLIETIPLNQFIARFGKTQLAELADQILSALDYLHCSGIVHGDLKPDNILLDIPAGSSSFLVRLTDFGMARLTPSGRGQIRGGSFPYMAPECLLNGWMDPRSDLFSLGVSLAELLLGRNPFATIDEYKAMLQPGTNPVQLPWHPEDRLIGNLITKLMHPDPNQRYLSAQDVLLDLAGVETPETSHVQRQKTGASRGYLVNPELIGRQNEMELLDSLYLELSQQQQTGVSIVFSGLPGAGFSRLLDEWYRQCRLKDIVCHILRSTVSGAEFGDVIACFSLQTTTISASAIEASVRQQCADVSTREQPIVYLIDSVHNMDGSSQELIKKLLIHPPENTLLVCVWNENTPVEFLTENSDTPRNSSSQQLYPRLHQLKPLSSTETWQLIASRFVPQAEPAIVTILTEYCGRLPASIFRSMNVFHKMGVITFQQNDWVLKQFPNHISREFITISGPEQWQLDSLSETDRLDILQCALINRNINTKQLSEILEFAPEQLNHLLEIGRKAGILCAENGILRFSSPAFEDISRRSLSSKHQIRLHAQIAFWLTKNNGSLLEIGRHHLAALQPEMGIKAFYNGAVGVLRSGSIDTALGLLERLQQTVSDINDSDIKQKFLWLIHYEQGNGHMRKGSHSQAEKHYQIALERTDQPAQKSSVMGNLAMTKLRLGETDKALELLREAAELAGRAEKPVQQAVLNAQLGNLYFQQDQLKDAVAAYRSALPGLVQVGNQRVAASVWNNLGSVMEALGDITGAYSSYIQALPLKMQLKDTLGEAILRHNIGHLLLERGRLRAAEVQLEMACAILQKQGESSHLLQFYGNQALVKLQQGEYRTAMTLLDQADPRMKEINDRGLLAWLQSIKALVLKECANPSAAYHLLRPEIERLENQEIQENDLCFLVYRYIQVAVIWEREVNQTKDLAPELTQLLKRTARSTNPILRHERLITEAMLCSISQNHSQGEHHLRQSLSIAQGNQLYNREYRSVFLLAKLLLEQNQPAAALDLFQPESFDFLKRSRQLPLLCRWTALAVVAYDSLGQHAAARHADGQAGVLLEQLTKKLPAETDPAAFQESFKISECVGNQKEAKPAGLIQQISRQMVQHSGNEMEDRRKLTLLLEVSRALNQEEDLDALLSRIVDHAIDLTGAERGFLYLKASTDIDDVLVTRNIARKDIFGSHSKISTSVLDDVMRTQRPVILDNSLSDENFKKRESILIQQLRTIMCAPLTIQRDNTGALPGQKSADGVLYVDGTASGPRFTALDRELFEALASHAAVGLSNLRKRQKLSQENRKLKQEIRQHFGFDQLIGTSKPMADLKQMLKKIAPSSAGVLILGESGTGKELVARTLHYNSPRETGPFLSINCAALAESVLESELFGVEAGVATGVKRRTGLFVQANKGTLFLDEVGDMPHNMQAKILRVLQERRVRPVGASNSIDIDVRIICATNKDLWKEVQAGNFREDLLYRLDIVTLCLPPLRERVEDIPVLAKFFVQKHAREMGLPVPGITLAAQKHIARYGWPGNVRELENQMQRALVLTELGTDIQWESLSPRVLQGEIRTIKSNEFREPGGEIAGIESSPGVASVHHGIVTPLEISMDELQIKLAVDQVETALITEALRRTHGNKTDAAKLLGLSREGLRLKMRRLDLTSGFEKGD